ncbi:MAG: flagellar basal body rod protein FlgC [Candidatus Cellulosilyticum pullistercoris]|uniref:Flagellar basal-body rod protein FlgC n=1 Tax=Candidatus Cellulosilyticum pullistercoris TaxID=2838521 RepID=A0A9E2KBJ3_9FIRM|nr:flagellar basal body rod protein FlgC [Candidatus Cellulosilyticum pullistercoris]
MSFFGSLDTSASGLTAQRLRLDIISQNMANASTTRTEEGGPYKRKSVVFEQVQNESSTSFSSILNRKKQSGNNGVRVAKIVEDESEGSLVYDPTHPDANKEGYVEMPNVNVIDEMVNMISASRSYEANVNSFNSMKAMFTKALEIGK